MQVAIVSDTHVPSRAAAVPAFAEEAMRAADHTLHAGDFDSPEALAAVREMAGGPDALTAVRGNTDPPSLDLPRVATATLGGVEFVVTHGDGHGGDYAEHVAATAREAGGPDAVGVAGHTHEPTDVTVGGTRVLNPGSATGAWPAASATVLLAETAGGLAVERREG